MCVSIFFMPRQPRYLRWLLFLWCATRISAIRCWTWPLLSLPHWNIRLNIARIHQHIKSERERGFGGGGLHRVGKGNWCLKLSHYHHSYVHESTCQSRRIIRAALGPETLRVNWEQDNCCQNMVESRSERLKVWKWNTGVQTILSWIKGLTLVLFYLTCRGEWGKMCFFFFFLSQ